MISYAHAAMPDTPPSWTRVKSLKKRCPDTAIKVKRAETKNEPRRIEARIAAEQQFN